MAVLEEMEGKGLKFIRAIFPSLLEKKSHIAVALVERERIMMPATRTPREKMGAQQLLVAQLLRMGVIRLELDGQTQQLQKFFLLLD